MRTASALRLMIGSSLRIGQAMRIWVLRAARTPRSQAQASLKTVMGHRVF